ncbi:putative D-tyrosyl-tRNA(Tyr) deacylase [Alloscardovia omnicolens]|uniref:Fatty acid ABC transporter ATP-binding/permease protein n=1 Tax=Alloscardovia omnicolens TaxID=419015 RepID=A0A2I1M467_9BIFI|nr:ABC transporter ATP-binding protein [Alloscardovia omnicolens]KWZ75880.1 putative D-tyrosyl-tRNA(Tyr) deacylase [Alloscardovia omnicolens]MDU6532394.1 ABC transporter ATP-binding protein [Alloscardovia omnicolens]PKZ14932.1 ABC transporter ATP-binding protein [Alloscardovia omnicolens]
MSKEQSAHRGTLKRLIKELVRGNGLRLAVVFVCIVIVAVANASMALFVKTLIDNYIVPLVGRSDPNFGPLAQMLGVMATIYTLGVLSNLLYARILVRVEQGTLKKLRDDMFEHMQKLPIRFFDTHQHGDIMSFYTNDTDVLRQAISQSMPAIFSSAISMLAAFISMLYLSVPFALGVLVYTVFVVLVIRFLAGTSGRFFVKQQKALGDVNGFIEEAINGQKVIKVFTHEEGIQKQFDEENDKLFNAALTANSYGNVTMPAVGNLGYLLYVIVALVGAYASLAAFPNFGLAGSSALTIGTLISFLTLSRSFINPIAQISNEFTMVMLALAGASRIFSLLDEKVEHDNGTVTLVNALIKPDGTITESSKHTNAWAWKVPEGIEVREDVAEISAEGRKTSVYTRLRGDIRFTNVDFSYNPDREILHDITLYAKPGQKVALVGATGAGKTTITNLVNRFYDIRSGQILYDGIDISHINKNDLRRSLGVVLQDVNLFTGTVMDNIRYGKLDATDDECIEAAKLANADGFIRMLPQGYDTVLSGDGSGLSQGQRQLLSIARAAVADPPVMILDEATSSIDTRTEEIVQAGMDALMEGRTVFVIAHRLSTVRNSDVIMVMDHGRIIERGTHDQLIEQKGQYYQLYTGAFELE